MSSPRPIEVLNDFNARAAQRALDAVYERSLISEDPGIAWEARHDRLACYARIALGAFDARSTFRRQGVQPALANTFTTGRRPQ